MTEHAALGHQTQAVEQINFKLIFHTNSTISEAATCTGRDIRDFARGLGPRLTLATFRSEDEYEIEYECDFSNLVRGVYINTSNTNLVPRASFSTGLQQ